jgi:hypothetical protein
VTALSLSAIAAATASTTRRRLWRELALTSGTTAVLSALVLWFGPPGSDMAAHVYQKLFFDQHGLVFWNNLWYAGRYSFVTYSPLYYPLASLVGIRVLAVLSVSSATVAYTLLVDREWGSRGRSSARVFAVVWALFVLSAAFPFALGAALALLALVLLQRSRRWSFALLAALTLAASTLAFTLLVVLLGGIALGRRRFLRHRLTRTAVVVVALLGGAELLLWALFPDGGRFPFPPSEFAAAVVFCTLGFVVTFRSERARLLTAFFALYLVACTLAFVLPSPVGENIARLRFAAFPIAVLALSLRSSRPRLLSVVVLCLALSWNVTPLAASFQRGATDAAQSPLFWAEPIVFLRHNLAPAYRVEAVDTAGHWEALYLAQAGIPLTRGWFRQDDFPQNQLLYDRLGVRGYLRWLRMLSVRYIVLTDGPLDYSARREAALIRAHPGLFPVVLRFPGGTIRKVPAPRPLVRGGPAPAQVVLVAATSIVFTVTEPGTYSIGVRYSPYFSSADACLRRLPGGFTGVTVHRAGLVQIHFDVGAESAARTLVGSEPVCT